MKNSSLSPAPLKFKGLRSALKSPLSLFSKKNKTSDPIPVLNPILTWLLFDDNEQAPREQSLN